MVNRSPKPDTRHNHRETPKAQLTLSWERVENVPGLVAYLIFTYSGIQRDGTPWQLVSRHQYSPLQMFNRYQFCGDTPDWYRPEGVHHGA